MKEKTTVSVLTKRLFVISLFCVFFHQAFQTSNNIYFFSKLNIPLKIFSYIFPVLTIVSNYWSFNVMRSIVLLAVIWFCFYAFISHGYDLFDRCLMIFAAANLSIDYVLKWSYRCLGSILVFFLIMLAIGFVDDTMLSRTIYVADAHSLGFQHYSGFSFRFMALTCLFLYFNTRRTSIPAYIGLVLATIIVFYFTKTRLHIIIVSAYALGCLSLYLKKDLFTDGIFKYLSIILYPISFFSLFLIGASYLLIGQDYVDLLDESFSGRMSLNLLAFSEYDITLLGNQIDMVGSRKLLETGEIYFTIDSGYVFWILGYGVLFTAFLLYAYSRIFYLSFRFNRQHLYLLMLVFSFANLINNFFDYYSTFPVLMLLLGDYRKYYRIPVLKKKRSSKYSFLQRI